MDGILQARRPRADERFAGTEHVFNLDGVIATLRAELAATSHGHSQFTLYRRGTVTTAVIAFEDGAMLPEHAARGLVQIRVLEGELIVRTAQDAYPLAPGDLLVLETCVRHSVQAKCPSAMLLTICMDGHGGTSG